VEKIPLSITTIAVKLLDEASPASVTAEQRAAPDLAESLSGVNKHPSDSSHQEPARSSPVSWSVVTAAVRPTPEEPLPVVGMARGAVLSTYRSS